MTDESIVPEEAPVPVVLDPESAAELIRITRKKAQWEVALFGLVGLFVIAAVVGFLLDFRDAGETRDRQLDRLEAIGKDTRHTAEDIEQATSEEAAAQRDVGTQKVIQTVVDLVDCRGEENLRQAWAESGVDLSGVQWNCPAPPG
jgi:hypothetical protein